MFKRFSHFILFLSLFLFSFTLKVNAYDSEYIKNFNTVIDLNLDGTIIVTENIEYDFYNLSRRGIIRDIPLYKTNAEGQKFKLNIELQDVLVNNLPTKYKTETYQDNFRIQIGDANKYLTGSHLYTIRYKVGGALSYFSDHDELYWNATGIDWAVPIKGAQVVINYPAQLKNNTTQKIGQTSQTVETPNYPLNTACYTGAYGSTVSNCEVFYNDNSVVISTTQDLPAFSGLTFVLGFKNNIIAVLEPTLQNTFVTDLLIVLGLLFLLCGWYLIYPIKSFKTLYAKKDLQQYNFKPVAAWFEPAKNALNQAYLPDVTALFLNANFNPKMLTGLILNWATKKYITLQFDQKTNDITLIKNTEPAFNFTYEQKMFKAFFESSNTVVLKQLVQNKTFKAAVANYTYNIFDQLINDNLADKSFKSHTAFYGSLGFISLLTANVLGLISSLLNYKLLPFTALGFEKAGQVKSLKNFLQSQEAYLNYQGDQKALFENLLPYAVALGVEKNWLKNFKDLKLSFIQDANALNNDLLVNSLVNSFNNNIKTSMYTPTSTSSSSGFSSGFSGGGFSGGGGGGGGGRSW